MNVDRVRDNLGTPIDPGIKNAVRLLNECGLATVASCEGHKEYGAGGAWIDFAPEAARTVLEALEVYEGDLVAYWLGDEALRVTARDAETGGAKTDANIADRLALINRFAEWIVHHKL